MLIKFREKIKKKKKGGRKKLAFIINSSFVYIIRQHWTQITVFQY
jgi:hypothetical protein